MKTLKFLIIFVIALFLSKGVMAATGNYNILHMIAPDSGQVLTNSVTLNFQDVNLNSKPTRTDTAAITADARYDFYADTAGYINFVSGDSNTYNGSNQVINVSPGDSISFWIWLWNDSNDTTAFKITGIGGDTTLSDNADSVIWNLAEDSNNDAIYDAADSDLAGTGSITTQVGRAGSTSGDTVAVVAMATIDPTATQNAADTLTLTLDTLESGTPYDAAA